EERRIETIDATDKTTTPADRPILGRSYKLADRQAICRHRHDATAAFRQKPPIAGNIRTSRKTARQTNDGNRIISPCGSGADVDRRRFNHVFGLAEAASEGTDRRIIVQFTLIELHIEGFVQPRCNLRTGKRVDPQGGEVTIDVQ